MKIKQVSELTSVPASAIRYYEAQGFLPCSRRNPNGYRDYSAVDVQNVKLIKFCQHLGFQLNELKALFIPEEDIDHQQMLSSLHQKQHEVAELIEQLLQKQKQLAILESTVKDYWSQGKCLPHEKIAELLQNSK